MLKYHVSNHVRLLKKFQVDSGPCGYSAGTIIISGLKIKKREVKVLWLKFVA